MPNDTLDLRPVTIHRLEAPAYIKARMLPIDRAAIALMQTGMDCLAVSDRLAISHQKALAIKFRWGGLLTQTTNSVQIRKAKELARLRVQKATKCH